MNTRTRREFLKDLAKGGLFLFGNSVFLPFWFRSGKAGSPSRVVMLHHPKATESIYRIRKAILREMFHRGLQALTGKPSPSESWSVIFPDLEEHHRIGIKVNCINRRLPSHPPLVEVIVESLIRFGVDPEHLIIWDRTNKELASSGFTLNRGKGVQCFGTDEKGIGHDSKRKIKVTGKTFAPSRILTEYCDFLINVPVLKDHNITGVTFSLKNHYGSIPLGDDIPWSFFRVRHMHSDHGDPHIAHLNALPLIRHKTRLIVGDALVGIFRGGPGGHPQWQANRLLLSFEPASIDAVARNLIEARRKAEGLPSILPKSRYIETAAKLGLGAARMDQIELRQISMG